jgi:DNA-binding Lrp family transcriptional regulator
MNRTEKANIFVEQIKKLAEEPRMRISIIAKTLNKSKQSVYYHMKTKGIKLKG